jgi:signal transduction histidine kinase
MIAMVTAVADGAPVSTSRPAATGRVAPWISGAVAVLVPLLAVAAVTLHLNNGDTDLTSWWYGGLTLALTMLVPGFLIARKQPRNPVGWLMLTACLCEALTSAGREYLIYGLLGGTAPGWLWLGWFTDSCYVVAIAALPTMLMLFPDGRPFGPRYLVAVPGVGLAIGWWGYLFTGDIADIRGHRLANPGAPYIPQAIAAPASRIGQLLVLLGMAVAAVLLVVRLRRAQGTLRLQLKWVVWAGTIELIEVGTEFLPNNPVAVYTSVATDALLVTAVAVAILKHRLFDIDVVINRTLVFVSLTAVVAGLYVAVVTAIAALLGDQPHLGPGLVATALVAVAFAPARGRLQRAVDRLMYGERRNPYRVMTQLGRRLERDDGKDELAVVVDTVTQALKLPYAAIVGPDGTVLAESGAPSAPPLCQPLSYQGASIGQLLVQPRERGGRFDRAEQRLLTDLARQVGAAVHAVRLSADLQASRTRLVSAKEEERRRLRRDLHDGLGPKLAALGLKLDAAHALVDTRPEASKDVLGKVKDDIRTTIDDVRHLVYGLRPPALDELGLLGALRECAGRFESGNAPVTAVHAPAELPPLPAAVEVAAYWIVNEALTNVVRHAGAKRCTVEVCLDDTLLRLAVRDDGAGLPAGWRPGVGTSSMRERAAELGGTVTVQPGPDGRGTEVSAVIPV